MHACRHLHRFSSLRAWMTALAMVVAARAGGADERPALIDTGVAVGPGVTVPFERPLIRDGMTATEQAAAIAGLVGDDRERFMKPGVTSRFEFRISKACELPAGGSVQRLDVWFIAHGSLDAVENAGLMEDFITGGAGAGDATAGDAEVEPAADDPRRGRARPLTDAELAQRRLASGTSADGSRVSYVLLDLAVIDKVRVSGICRSERFRGPDSITVTLGLDDRFLDDPDLPARWCPLERDADDGVIRPGAPRPYAVATAYAKASRLVDQADAILVEVHVVFAEPEAWFDGRNLLRSKLPPLLQQSVQAFRRKVRNTP